MPTSDKFAKYPNNVTDATIKLLEGWGLSIETVDQAMMNTELNYEQLGQLIQSLKPGTRPHGFVDFNSTQKIAYLDTQFKNWRLRQQALAEDAIDTAPVGPRSDELLTSTLKGMLVNAAGEFLKNLSDVETHRVACLIAKQEVNGTVEELRAFILEAASEALFDIPVDMITDEPDVTEEPDDSTLAEAVGTAKALNDLLSEDRRLTVRVQNERVQVGVREEVRWLS